MFNVEVNAKESDLFLAYQSTKTHLMQVAPDRKNRNAIAAMLVVAAARDVANKDPDLHGTFTITGLLKDANMVVIVDSQRISIEPAPVEKPTKLPKPKMKTSIPPKKGPVRKNQDQGPDPRKQRIRIKEDLFKDGNGYYFNKQGQAVGADGKPTADPYNISIDPTLPPGPAVPVVPQGSAGFYGSFGGDDDL